MNYKTKLTVILYLFVSLAWSLKASASEISAQITPAGFGASSDDGNIAGNAFDGDFSTRWSAFGSGESLTIDLGTQYQVTELNVAWYKGDVRQSHYQIDMSDNASSWVTVAASSSTGSSLSLEPISINYPGRYIRLIGLGNSVNDWNSITEITISGSQEVVPPSNKDSFGITKLYPTMLGYTDWESTHWNNGNARILTTSDRDYDDPTGWAHVRGNSPVSIDGKGVMAMGGSSPRLYINPYPGYEEIGAEQLFKNIEATVYYKRKGSDGANWGGLIMGLRSGPMGHGSAGGDNCDATTYTARFRHDGKWDFEKELKHSESVSSGYTQLFSGAIPAGQWIGMKYLAYNIENNTKVKLELWIDDTSNGDVSNGGEWRLLGEYVDDGNWVDPDVEGCSYSGDKIILNGGGVAYLRNTDAQSAEYKYFSLREIDTGNNPNTDSFGITKFYPTMSGYTDWESTHWNNSNARTLVTSDRDYDDPTGWTHVRGNSPISIDGNGVMAMGGASPRLYINPYPGYEESGAEQLFKNIEATVYYKRKGSDGKNWGGLIMGLRSGPMGHSSDGDYCDATTYTARFRHDGKWDFEKELKHSESVSSGYSQLFPSALPADQWIGMKYLAYNIEHNTKVKLELWIDDTSNGDVSNGGEWRLLGEFIDDGNWVDPEVEGCSYSGDKIILNGGGVAYLRNTDAQSAEYKYFSLREIDISDTGGEVTPPVELTPVTIESSSDDGNVADNVLDDDFLTRWSALGSGENLTIDLGTQYHVTAIQAAWFKGDERQSHYQIDISVDGTNWIKVTDSSSSGTTLALETINVNFSGRYLRIIGLGNSLNDWNSITELKITGSDE